MYNLNNLIKVFSSLFNIIFLFYFSTILNSPRTRSISSWISSVNAEPGFFQEVFDYLKHLPLQDRDCNLIFDAMAIRKKIIYDHNYDRFVEYCDLGGIQVE